MIPPFNDDGYLPPGIHPASLTEIAERFGLESELRRVQMESVRWLVEVALRAGVRRIVLNGSFVTDQYEPNDVDCVLLIDERFPVDPAAEAELRQGLPFLQIDIANQFAFDRFTQRFFASDRFDRPKGMIEVIS